MKKLFIINGASGSGKTTLVKAAAQKLPADFRFCHFDSVGVPNEEAMKEKFGTWENWGKVTTDYWIDLIKREYIETNDVVFDAHTRPADIEEACSRNGIEDYQVILLDCADDERVRRLIARKQPELANQTMLDWAQFLRTESARKGYTILDTTGKTADESLSSLIAFLGVGSSLKQSP